MKRFSLLLLPTVLTLFTASCCQGPEVLQGKVVSYDTETKDLVVRDERPPNRLATLSLNQAEVGSEPQVNDLVRIAYREEGGRQVASRVMNLTRQQEIGIKVK
jgi:hypothetical protein